MNPFSYLIQEFLSRYFLLEMVAGKFLDKNEKQKIYYDLAGIFCLQMNRDIDEFPEIAASEPFSGITDRGSYDRFCRFVEFAEGNGQEIRLSDAEKTVLARKRDAADMFSQISDNNMILTEESVYPILLSKAMIGNVTAMELLSYMEYNGICMTQDKENAVKRMRLCARWNSFFGNLFSVAFDTELSQQHFNRLFTILNNENRKQVFSLVCECRGSSGPFEKDAEARILEKAFMVESIRRTEYDHAFANIVFSKMLSVKDKEKLLLNSNSQQLFMYQDIPFDAYMKKELCFDKSKAEAVALPRRDECEKILRNLKIAQLGKAEIYQPLLVTAQEEAICDMYSDMVMKVLEGSDIVSLDAGALKVEELQPVKENIFLRSLSETKNTRTVFIINNCDELSGEALLCLKNFLSFTYRKKFTVLSPSVTLDISDIVIILFAKSFSSDISRIAEECETVAAKKISDTEKEKLIEKILSDRKEMFGKADIEIEKEALEALFTLEISKVTSVIDSALRTVIFEEDSVITRELITEALPQQKNQKIKLGFGITEGESK